MRGVSGMSIMVFVVLLILQQIISSLLRVVVLSLMSVADLLFRYLCFYILFLTNRVMVILL